MRLPSGDHAPNELFHVANGGPLPTDCMVMEPNCHMLKAAAIRGVADRHGFLVVAVLGSQGFGSGCAT